MTTKAFHKARKAAEGKGGAKRKASADGDEAGTSDAQAPAKKKGKATKKGGKSAAAVKTESGSGEDSDGECTDALRLLQEGSADHRQGVRTTVLHVLTRWPDLISCLRKMSAFDFKLQPKRPAALAPNLLFRLARTSA